MSILKGENLSKSPLFVKKAQIFCDSNQFTKLNFRPSSADLLGSGGSGPGVPDSDNVMTIPITKGGMGFGFTIADSQFGQKVKKILDRPRYVLTKIAQNWRKIRTIFFPGAKTSKRVTSS